MLILKQNCKKHWKVIFKIIFQSCFLRLSRRFPLLISCSFFFYESSKKLVSSDISLCSLVLWVWKAFHYDHLTLAKGFFLSCWVLPGTNKNCKVQQHQWLRSSPQLESNCPGFWVVSHTFPEVSRGITSPVLIVGFLPFPVSLPRAPVILFGSLYQ